MAEENKGTHISDNGNNLNPVNFIRNRITETAASFKDFKSDYSDSLCLIFTNMAIAASFIGLIVLAVIFAADGGYAKAFEEISANGISFPPPAADDNVYMMYSGIPGIITEVLLILYAAALIVHFYRHTGVVRRILMSAVLALESANVIFAALFLPYIDKVGQGEITVDETQYELLESIYYSAPLGRPGNYFLIFGAIIMVFAVILLLTHSWSRRLFLHALPAVVLVFAVFPLLLYMIENIVALVFGAILLLVIIVMIFLGISSVSSGSESSSGDGSSAKSSGAPEKSNSSASKNGSSEKKQNSSKQPRTYTLPSSGVKLHKVHGILHDYIETSNIINNSELCTLYDLQKGKFIIYDSTGRRLSENDIMWKN